MTPNAEAETEDAQATGYVTRSVDAGVASTGGEEDIGLVTDEPGVAVVDTAAAGDSSVSAGAGEVDPSALWAEADAATEAGYMEAARVLQSKKEKEKEKENDTGSTPVVGGMPYVEDTFQEDEETDTSAPNGTAVYGGVDSVRSNDNPGVGSGSTGLAESSSTALDEPADVGGSVSSEETKEVIVAEASANGHAKSIHRGAAIQLKRRKGADSAGESTEVSSLNKSGKAGKRDKPGSVGKDKKATRVKDSKEHTARARRIKESRSPSAGDTGMEQEASTGQGISKTLSTVLTVLTALVLGVAGLFGGMQYAGIYLEQLVTKALGG